MNRLMRAVALPLVLCSTLCCAAPCRAEMPVEQMQQTLARATELFDQGAAQLQSDPAESRRLLSQAIDEYQRILREGEIANGGLYYNIANAYMLQGDTGRAILNYRRALELTPGDVRVVANLSAARRQVTAQIAPAAERRVLRTVLFWHYDLSPHTRFAIFAGAFGAMWILALLRVLSIIPRSAWWGVGALALLWAAPLASLLVDRSGRAQPIEAVVTASQVIGRKGPGEAAYEPSFAEPLSAGVEVQVVERRPRWILVRLADGRETWAPETAIEVI